VQDTPAPALQLSPPVTANGVAAAAPSSTVAPSAAAVLGAKVPSPPQTLMGGEVPEESMPSLPTVPILGMGGGDPPQKTQPTVGEEIKAAAKGPQTEQLAVDGQSQPDAAERAQRAAVDDFTTALEVKLENMNDFPATQPVEALGQTMFNSPEVCYSSFSQSVFCKRKKRLYYKENLIIRIHAFL